MKRILVLALLPLVAACDKPAGRSAETPELAWAQMTAAWADADWELYWDSHAEEAQPELFVDPIGMLKLAGAMKQPGSSIRDDAIALSKKHGITEWREPAKATTLQEMFPGCRNHRAWFVDLMKLIASGTKDLNLLANHFPTISEVRISGDTASAILEQGRISWRKRFLKRGDAWLIGDDMSAIVDDGSSPDSPTKTLKAMQEAVATRGYEALFDCTDPNDRDLVIKDLLNSAWFSYQQDHPAADARVGFSEEIARLVLGDKAPTGKEAREWLDADPRLLKVQDRIGLYVKLGKFRDSLNHRPDSGGPAAGPEVLPAGSRIDQVLIQGRMASARIILSNGKLHPIEMIQRDGIWKLEAYK